MMSMINELLNRIDELKYEKEIEKENHSKQKSANKSRIRELEEDKKRAGLRGDRSSVLKITRQIKSLQNENLWNSLNSFDLLIKNCEEEINEIIVDYSEKNFSINDIFLIENIPKNVQEEWLEKSNFGEKTGYLYVDEILEYKYPRYYYWRYYNPFLETEFKAQTLKSLKNKVESRGEKLIGFDEKLVKKSKHYDSNKYLIVYDIKIDKLARLSRYSNNEKVKILRDLKLPLTKEQLTRLCELSSKFYVDDCVMCFTYLDSILKEYDDIIDKNLLNKVKENSSKTWTNYLNRRR